ncbi:MAG TPA: lysylphosphatidylglycerol synthase domain-containing protein, partial [Thermoanaerobaculia bacterium]|nr:lysylphosphatidylglycerol synthase domain-containing protein [Thermoanaerobaculia bacterium]
MSSRLAGVLLAAVVVFGLVRLLRGADRSVFASARPSLLAAAFVCYALAFAARAARLELLLPPGERLSFLRAFSVAGATTFLIQVLPFRSGEPAGWALLKREMGATWARAGAVAAVVKVVDAATFLLAGLVGAAALSFTRGRLALGAAAALSVLAGAALLLLLPRIGAGLVTRVAQRAPEGSRRAALMAELSAG